MRIFSDRERFEQTRQPHSRSTWTYGQIPITEDQALVITISEKEPRKFASIGRIRMTLSDNREIIIEARVDDVKMFIADSPIPVFSPVINVISIGDNFHYTVFGSMFSAETPEPLEGLSRYFGISVGEMEACIKGAPTDSSLFGYSYEIREDLELYLKIRGNDDFYPLGTISSGEQARFVLDMAIRIGLYSAKVKPTAQEGTLILSEQTH